MLLRKVQSPAEVKRQILAETICGEREYVAQEKAVKQIYAGKLGASYTLLLPQKDAEGAAGKEATQLLEELDTYAKSQLAEIDGLKADQPAAMIRKLREIGTPPENEKTRSRFLKKKQSRIKRFASQAKSFIKANPESAFSAKLTEQLTLYGVTLNEAS